MKNSTSTIINEELNHSAYNIFCAIKGQAEPTSKVIDANTEEWVEYAELDGVTYAVYSEFGGYEITFENGDPKDAEDYNWSIDNVTRIEIVD